MGDRLKNKVAIVTGSGQGIGKAIAVAMAKEGAKVVINDYIREYAETTAKEIIDREGQAVPFCGSIAEFEVARKLVQTAVDNFGKLDILVNNAGGVDTLCRVWDMTEEDWDRTISIHLKGSFNCIRHSCPLMMQQRWGRIINTTSSAWLTVLEHSQYGAAKAGTVGLTRAVARDIGEYGVTCNAYAPTAMTQRMSNEDNMARIRRAYEAGLYTKQRYEELISPPPPETIPPFIIYLCTDEAADINGQVFDVTGGNIAIYSQPIKKKTISKEGLWTIEELVELVPKVLLKGYKNPAPAQPRK